MKFQIDRDALLKPVQAVIGVVEKRHTMAILANILFQLEGDTLSITATDLEIEMVAKTRVKSGEAGSITVPGKKLLDICRSLPEGSDVVLELQGNQGLIKAGRSRFTLATLPAQEFPKVESKLGDQTFEVPQHLMLQLLKRTYFAMAQQDVRYFLNGLLLEVTDKYIRTVATDGHRLAMSTLDMKTEAKGKTQVIIPRKAVLEFIRLLEEEEAPVKIMLGANHMRAETPAYSFTTKLLEGRYPDYNRVIPGEGENILVTEKMAMKQTLSRTAILSNEKYRGIRMQFTNNLLKLVANNPEQEEAQDELDVSYKGVDMEVGFNVNYLLDVLNVLDADQVQLSFTGSNSSALVKGHGDTNNLYVVMPIRL